MEFEILEVYGKIHLKRRNVFWKINTRRKIRFMTKKMLPEKFIFIYLDIFTFYNFFNYVIFYRL